MKPAVYAVLNLDALQHNLARVRECASGSKVMAVIKANAYGHGLLRVANALEGVDAFAVARVDEAVRLRRSGITERIAVLEGFSCEEELNSLVDHDLEAIIHCSLQLDLLEKINSSSQVAVWLKLDSGMNRLGFKAAEFDSIYRRLINIQSVAPFPGLITHLANADDRDDIKTLRQIEIFDLAVQDYPGERSIANSAGVLGWAESIKDWVRPGIMLFGVSPFVGRHGEQLGVKAVMSLHSRLIAIKRIEEGETVGYGGSWVCRKPTLMGVVAVGYGDGYPRQAKSGTPVLVNGKRVFLIGRVSMDMITVDLENCPDARPGDPVTLWGNGLPVEEVAEHADTIAYTLICGITQRVQIVEE